MDQMNITYKADESVSWHGDCGKLAVSTDMCVHMIHSHGCALRCTTHKWPANNIRGRTIDDNQMVGIIQMAINIRQARQQTAVFTSGGP